MRTVDKADILKKIFSDTETQVLSTVRSKFNILNDKVDEFEILHKKFIKSGKDSINPTYRNLDQITILIEHLTSIIDWLKSNQADLESVFAEIPWSDWQELQLMTEKIFPDKLELPYLDENTLPAPDKSNFFYLIKKPLYKYKYYIYVKRKSSGRIIPLQGFLQLFFNVPVSEFIFLQWQKMIQAYIRIILQIHQASDILKDEILLTQEMTSANSYWQELRSQNPEKTLQNYQKIIPEIRQMFTNLENSLESELKEFLEKHFNHISDVFDIAGSPLLPVRKFPLLRGQLRMRNLEKKYKRSAKKWQHEAIGAKDEWLKDLELSLLQVSAADIYFETQEIINQKIQDKISVLFNDIKEVVQKTNEKFLVLDESNEEDLRNLLLVENVSLVKLLRMQKLPELLDKIFQANIEKTFKGFFSRIEGMVNQLSEEHTIFTDRDSKNVPPDSRTTEIPLKELVKEEIVSSSFKAVESLVESYEIKKTTISRSISNLDQIVEFNLDAAHNLLKERDDKDSIAEARQIAVEGLERTLKNLEEMENSYTQDIDNDTRLFSEIVRNFELDLQKLADNEQVLQLKIRLAHAKTKEKILSIQKRFLKTVINLLPLILKKSIWLLKKIHAEWIKIRKVTGLDPQYQISANTLTTFLIDTNNKINKMPYIYRRLFSIEPLVEKRFLFARDTYLEQAKQDLENFKNGYQVATAIVGEKGNGKTTILNFIESEIFVGFSLVKIDIKTTIHEESDLFDMLKVTFGRPNDKTWEDLEEYLNSQNSRKICICENIQNLFLRVIDGFDVIERFLLFLMNTRYKVFWVVTSGHYAWEYLDRFIKISDNFIRVLFLEVFSREELEEVVLKRHQVSGYRLVFKDNERILKNRQYRKMALQEDRQNFLHNLFFNQLTEISGGNIKSALLYWLSAIINFDEEIIEIACEIELDHTMVLQLPSEDLFSLAAFIEHEYLNAGQHALVFNQDLNEAKLLIGRLYRKGYLTRLNDDYSVSPFLYRPVVKALKLRNILN